MLGHKNQHEHEIAEMEGKRIVNRRDFLKLGLGALSALAAVELGGAGLLFLRARSLEGEFGGVITAGPVEQFANGSVTEFHEGNFYLVRGADSGFLAVYRRCPHLGCMVSWNEEKGKFYCPCHASSFDRNGDFQNELVSRALDTFPVLFEDGLVKVDTSQVQSRENYQPEQVSYFK
jgi:cytochrome b6-f complex iron-sulfur subunit